MTWRRAALAMIVLFAATMGWDLPAPPVPIHAVWADVALFLAALLTAVAIMRGELPWPNALPLAYGAWVIVAAHGEPSARFALQLGAAGLVALALVANAHARSIDPILRAWIYGVVVLGIVALGLGIAAQLGVGWADAHNGAGELGLAFRPAGVQRVGVLAELCLVPLLVVFADGERLLGRRARRIVLVVLGIVLVAGLTRTLIAVAVGIVCLRARGIVRALLVLALLACVVIAARFDVRGTGVSGIRWRIAAAAFAKARAHPLRGNAAEEPAADVPWPAPTDSLGHWDAHCTPIDLVTRSGVLALLLFALCVGVALARTRGHDPRRAALHAALWATAFDALSVDVERFRHVWLLLGLTLVLNDESSSRMRPAQPSARR